jgi:hypothetical protein
LVQCHIALLTIQSLWSDAQFNFTSIYSFFFNFLKYYSAILSVWHVVLAFQILWPKFCMHFVILYVLHALPISVLVFLLSKYLVSSRDALFIVKFSLTFKYFRSIANKYITQRQKLPRSFYLHKWKANMTFFTYTC